MKRIFILFVFIAIYTNLFGQTHYVGVENPNISMSCNTCHSTEIDSWKQTKHAIAQDSVSSSHYGYDCLKCHNTGWNEDVENFGMDEYVEKDTTMTPDYNIMDPDRFEMVKNVQCEACHGPVGNEDGSLNMGHTAKVTSFQAETCGTCHQDAHHPYMEQWSESGHASGAPAWFNRENNASCYRCHFAQDFVAHLTDENYDATTFEPEGELADITCATCHDPHGNENPGNLRVPSSSEGSICDECHNAHITEVDINDTPHHTTSEIMSGSELFGYQYEGEEYENSFHTKLNNRCVTCHVHTTPYDYATGSEAVTGHTFEPRVEACQECHTDIEDFDYRGVQTEIKGLLDELELKLTDATAADSATDDFKKANYNYLAVEAEGSFGIHNTKLTRKLLQDAISNFTPTSVELTDENIPSKFTVEQNYPNPFNPTTTIKFSLPKSSNVKVTIYDAIGKEIKVLVDEYRNAGTYQARWNAANRSSGVYLFKVKSGDYSITKKMMLVK